MYTCDFFIMVFQQLVKLCPEDEELAWQMAETANQTVTHHLSITKHYQDSEVQRITQLRHVLLFHRGCIGIAEKLHDRLET